MGDQQHGMDLLQMATARIGIVLVNINPAHRPRELAYALQHSEVEGLFVIPKFRSSDYIGMLVTLMPELKQMPHENLRLKDFPALRSSVVYDPVNPLNPLQIKRKVENKHSFPCKGMY